MTSLSRPLACLGFLALAAGVIAFSPVQSSGQGVGAPSGLQSIEEPGAELLAIWRARADGTNEVLAMVDGVPITTESIRAELEGTLETAIQTEVTFELARPGGRRLTRDQAETRVIFREVRRRASSMIIRRIATATRLTVSDSQVDSRIEQLKEWRGIAKDDLSAWAEYTIDNFGKTPLKFREGLRGELMEYLALEVMAGMYGPTRGLELPVYLSREVTPSEMLTEYEATKSAWRVLSDIDYTLVAVGISTTASISTRQIVDAALNEARTRLRNESLEGIETYLKAELARINDDRPELQIKANVVSSDDTSLDMFGRYVRGLQEGDTSQALQHNDGTTAWRFFLRMNKRSIGETRDFSDIVVQSELRGKLLELRGNANKDRVRDALLERAVVVPSSLIGR